ncbi:peptidoglycan D,D-transpeptidase FtsI family protein [Cohnella yongneupensis]|uniref:Peptidoglycan D,D-transpeptidase FtsI family protein n=1 Tax=Cohnella yongneupensis TaxID=425006 RepID=A0ABW0R835_9BACL
MNREWARRAFHVLLLIAVVLGVEGARLAWLQLGFGNARTASGSLLSNAVMQRSDGLLLDSGRGQFRDRYGRLMTGETVQTLAAFPDNGMPRGTATSLDSVSRALKVESATLEDWLAKLREPAFWKEKSSLRALDLSDAQIKAVNEAGLTGVAVLPVLNRYPKSIAPLHAIGYISQHPERVQELYGTQVAKRDMSITRPIGGSGLEKSMDRLLQGIGPTAVIQVTDAKRQPLHGLGLRMMLPNNEHYPLQVTTTIDLDIQQAVDRVLEGNRIKKGAVVVLDAENADIAAMASLPRLNPYSIGELGTDERNHALHAEPPGSVFKTVTLAAAIESGIARWDDVFYCSGHYGKYGLKCWKHEGHGVITLKEAFAQSCNVVFAQLAERMDPAWLQITADRLGLGRQIGWHTEKFVDGAPLRLLQEEEQGEIFLSRKLAEDGGIRAGTGIGQRDVRVTPLQAANMVVSVLHDGKVLSPRLVKDVRYADGGIMTDVPVHAAKSKYGQIEPRTAALLRDGMRAVVQSGTAERALAGSDWPLAGKSGTAELAGKDKARNDHWFVGYGPAKGKPHYAVAVLLEDQPAGLRNRAAELFGEIMAQLRLLDHRAAERAAER